jgi:sporulation protein YlmC with PRC-barrel domain
LRTFSSMLGRVVETESGRRIGRCCDMRAVSGRGNPRIDELVVGRRGRLEHFGIGTPKGQAPDAVPWEAVVRIEGDKIVVRDGTEIV